MYNSCAIFSIVLWHITATIIHLCVPITASGPATPDSSENTAQHQSPESGRKVYWRTLDGGTGGHGTPGVFSDHPAGTNMSPGGFSHLKSPAPGRTRSVSDSSAPRRGTPLAMNAHTGTLLSGLTFYLTFTSLLVWCFFSSIVLNLTHYLLMSSTECLSSRLCDEDVHPVVHKEWEGSGAAGHPVGDPGGVRDQPQAAQRSDEHEQRDGKQHVR